MNINQEHNKYSQSFLRKKISSILERYIEENYNLTFYGIGRHLPLLDELLPKNHGRIFLTDTNPKSIKNYIKPEQLNDFSIDIVIIASFIYRLDIKYELKKSNYKGIVLDIYDCLAMDGIYLALPFYLYDGEENNDSGCNNEKYYSIEFYLVDAFEIYHFMPLYKKLKVMGESVRFIAESPEINTAGNWFNYKETIEILKKEKLDYSEECCPSAKLAITTQRAGVLSKYYKRRMRWSYGNGLNKGINMFGNSELAIWGFDYPTVHGMFRRERMEFFLNDNQKLLEIGYPKHIEFFKNMPKANELKSSMGIPMDKPILLLAPTWGDGTAVDLFFESIRKFNNKFFIISKLHHCTERLKEEVERKKQIISISDIVLTGNFDIEKFALLGDVAIIDSLSGAATEIPYLNKSIKTAYMYDCSWGEIHDNLYDEIRDLGTIVTTREELFSFLDKPDDIPDKREEVLKEIYGIRGEDHLDELISVIIDDN